MRANNIVRLGSPFLVSSFFCALVACGGEAAPAAPAAAPAAPAAPTAAPLPPPVAAGSPESDKVEWKQDASAKNCHTAKAGGDLVAAVSSEAKGCVSNMH